MQYTHHPRFVLDIFLTNPSQNSLDTHHTPLYSLIALPYTTAMERARNTPEKLATPTPLEVNFAGIPEVLQEHQQWVVWKYQHVEDEIKKPPFTPQTGRRASVTKPSTWGSFTDAQRAYATGQFAGVGFVLTTGIIGIDIDHCIEEDTISDEASLLAATLHTYTELSPSGTGLHLLMEGSLPGHYRRKGTVEMYQAGRYLTVTGQSVQDTPLPLSKDHDTLEAVYHLIFSQPEQTENTVVGVAHRAEGRSPFSRTDAAVLEKAYTAKNGANFRRYYEGDYSLWEGKGARHRSHSEADFTLVLMLIYWTNNDTAQVDRLFRQSGLMREKWERPLHASETYGERIIKDAIQKGRY